VDGLRQNRQSGASAHDGGLLIKFVEVHHVSGKNEPRSQEALSGCLL
jgi:hypothetical protein